MIPLGTITTEELAIHFFLQKEASVKAFKAHLEKQGISLTIQGIYKAINKLLKETVLVKNKRNIQR